MSEVMQKASKAKEMALALGCMSTRSKDDALEKMAHYLEDNKRAIIEANSIDLENALKKGLKDSLIDRLKLDEKRITSMAEGLKELKNLPDPVGEVVGMWKRPNGLAIGLKRVPLGVVGIIYEARPNVTVDAVGLCIKTGNSVILRGGSDAINSNKAIVDILKKALNDTDLSEDCIQLIEDTKRETAVELMKMNGIIDVLIPRGGAGLIQSVVQNSQVPVIQTGTGNCHIFVDEFADLGMACKIIINAKTQRPGVCNAQESLLVDKAVADEFVPEIVGKLQQSGVQVRGCQKVCALCSNVKQAVEEDWGREYLDMIISVKVVDGIEQAIGHINKYGTGHSEAIITDSYSRGQKFLEQVDAAAVYINASTRFTDGFEFGFGAEIGISTQKLHARGPMGLKELTTTKYIIYGDGQIRE
ncbi:MAG: glutamate-5-semialdehyde dehydrogenase [Clostridia bacterium]|nr:glutamate-5-semialdehyde dehydrogenase [Clostridia bacterium]